MKLPLVPDRYDPHVERQRNAIIERELDRAYKSGENLNAGLSSIVLIDGAGVEWKLFVNTDGSLQTRNKDTAALGTARWDDLLSPVTVAKVGAAAPTWGTSYGGYLFAGTGVTVPTVEFIVQISHGWVEGSDLRPHVHWAKTTAASGNVEWILDYKWLAINTVADAVATQVKASTPVADTPDTNTADKHLLTSFGAISGAGKKISDILWCKISRDPAATNDTYAADANLISFDVHIQKDGEGSIQLYSKNYESRQPTIGTVTITGKTPGRTP